MFHRLRRAWWSPLRKAQQYFEILARMNAGEFYTLADVVRLLASPPAYPGPSRPTLWRWTQRGLMPQPIKIGGRLFWRKAAIEEWLIERSLEGLR